MKLALGSDILFRDSYLKENEMLTWSSLTSHGLSCFKFKSY